MGYRILSVLPLLCMARMALCESDVENCPSLSLTTERDHLPVQCISSSQNVTKSAAQESKVNMGGNRSGNGERLNFRRPEDQKKLFFEHKSGCFMLKAALLRRRSLANCSMSWLSKLTNKTVSYQCWQGTTWEKNIRRPRIPLIREPLSLEALERKVFHTSPYGYKCDSRGVDDSGSETCWISVGELELDECSKASITFYAQVLEDCGNHGCALIAVDLRLQSLEAAQCSDDTHLQQNACTEGDPLLYQQLVQGRRQLQLVEGTLVHGRRLLQLQKSASRKNTPPPPGTNTTDEDRSLFVGRLPWGGKLVSCFVAMAATTGICWYFQVHRIRLRYPWAQLLNADVRETTEEEVPVPWYVEVTLNEDGTHVSEEYGMDEKNPARWDEIPPIILHPDGDVSLGMDQGNESTISESYTSNEEETEGELCQTIGSGHSALYHQTLGIETPHSSGSVPIH